MQTVALNRLEFTPWEGSADDSSSATVHNLESCGHKELDYFVNSQVNLLWLHVGIYINRSVTSSLVLVSMKANLWVLEQGPRRKKSEI